MRNGMIENKWRDRGWYSIGKLDRTDGPAVEYANGDREWFLNNQLHREDGPAIELENGTRRWYSNGQRHRTDGPAFIYSNGGREWWLNGVEYTEEEYNTEMRLRRCGLSTKVPYEWKSTVDSSA